MYNIDFNDIAVKLTPIRLKRVKLISFVFSFLKPLNTLLIVFNQLRATTNYSLQFNGQVIYLEHYLNDLYDPINRGIYIQDTANTSANYLFNDNEQRPPLYIHNEAEQGVIYLRNSDEDENVNHFIIKVPNGITYNELLMRKQVDYYRVAGKQYTIQIY